MCRRVLTNWRLGVSVPPFLGGWVDGVERVLLSLSLSFSFSAAHSSLFFALSKTGLLDEVEL